MINTLLTSQHTLYKLLNGLPVPLAIVTLETDANIVFLNEPFIRTFGYRLEDIPMVADWAVRAYPDPDYRHEVFSVWDPAVARAIETTGHVESMEFKVHCHNGTVCDTVFQAVVLDNQLLITLTDITASKQTKAELKSARQALEETAYELTENIPVGTYTMVQPADGGMASFAFMSTRFLEITGLDRAEAQSDPLKAFACVHPDDFDAWVHLNIEAFRTRSPFYGEARLIVNDQIRWITAESTPRPLADGSTVWEGVLFDVTDRKLAEQALIEAKLRAERLEKAKSDFLATMSHEIRTPMNAVLGLADVLSREALNPKQLSLVSHIRDAGESLLGIVNDILDLSKIEAQQLHIDNEPFALDTVLAKIENLQGWMARDKGLTLHIEAPNPPLSLLQGDPLRVEQVLRNLVSNAIKFTEQGEVSIHVRVLERNADGLRLRFEVRDTGIGIPPDILAGLFSPFTQADATTYRHFGGTGLGLSISKYLVKLMGGEIGANSQQGTGSLFWYELPLTWAPVQEPPDELSLSATNDEQRLHGLRILIVEDNLINQYVVEQMLELEGAETTAVSDGLQAVDCLRTRSQDFDAVLMDVQMPVMDGLTATRTIRQELKLDALPIIAFTAGVLSEQQTATMAAGVNDILTKPLDAERMVSVLLQWTRRKSAAPSTKTKTTTPSPSSPPPSRLTADSNSVADFPVIPGINRIHAAQIVDYNLSTFLQLLTLFTTDMRNVIELTRQDLARGEHDSAARRLHTLRGGAGHLGALELMSFAAGLETAVRSGKTDLEPQLTELEQQIAALIAASAPWLNSSNPLTVDSILPTSPPVSLSDKPSAAHILIVDDDPVALRVLHKALASMGELSFAASGVEALEHVQHRTFDLALLDANMPGMDGFTLCRTLQQNYPELPVIFVTSSNDFTSEIKALEAGAIDFISKPINPPVIRARIGAHLKLKAQSDVLRSLGNRDSLTGLANRRALDERLLKEWRRTIRQSQPLSVLLMDVDYFKAYNDHYGHLQGDDCLRQVAEVLTATVTRSGDLVARYGGEEFAVLLPNSHLEAATALAEKICTAIRDRAIPHARSGIAEHLTLSIGVASTIPTFPESLSHSDPSDVDGWIKDLLDQADQALYAAKTAGRNQVKAVLSVYPRSAD